MEESVRFSNNETRSKQSQSPVSLSSSKFIGKVFLYTAGALLISAVVAAVIGIICSTAITPNYDYSVITLDAEKMKPYSHPIQPTTRPRKNTDRDFPR